MLNVFHLGLSDATALAIRPKTGAGVQLPRSSSATSLLGMTRSRLPAKPPPVTWQNVLTFGIVAASARQSWRR